TNLVQPPVEPPAGNPPERGAPLPAPSTPNPRVERPATPPPLGEPPAPPPLGDPSMPGVLPAGEQTKVNKAIDLGVRFLKDTQGWNGVWGDLHPVGMAALPALTLLECGVPPSDPAIQRAAVFV